MTAKRNIPIRDKKRMAVRAALLRALYVGGALTIIAVAPHMARLIGGPDRGKKNRAALYQRMRYAKAQLKYRGLVVERPDGKLELTELGKANLEKVLLREYAIPPQALWDGKWRILMFDIHERRRGRREQLRKLLAGAGFVRLQHSVWVHPYPCDEFVQLVRAHLASGVGELRFIVANALERDAPLRAHFGLP